MTDGLGKPRTRTSTVQGKLGVICTPGSYTGAYGAGLLKALDERGISPDVFQGSSVGALNASGCMSVGVEDLIEVWRYVESRGPEFLYSHDSIWSLIYDLAKDSPLYGRRGLRELINAGVFGRKIINHPVELRVVVFNETDGRVEVRSNRDDVFRDNPELFEKFVLASCSVPGIFPPVEIEDKIYSDAVFFSVTDLLYQDCDTVFVLFNDPDNITTGTRRANIKSWWLQRVIGRREDYKDYIEYIRKDLRRHREKCVFFKVEERILSSNKFKEGDITRAIEAGYEKGLEILDNLDI